MDGKRVILSLFFFLLAKVAFSQSISYTYTDPCTGVQNTITLDAQSGTTIMFYAGQYRLFTMAELQAGAYEAWVDSINAAAPPGSNPCAGNAGAVSGTTTAAVGTNVTNTVTTITGALSLLGNGNLTSSSGGMDVGSSNSNSNGNNESDSGNGDSDDSGDSGNSNSSSSPNSGNSSGSSSSSSSGSTGSNTSGSSTSGSTGSESGGSSGSSSSGSSGATGGSDSSGSSSGSSSGGGNSSGGGTGSGESPNTDQGTGEVGTSTDDSGDDNETGGLLAEKSIESESGGESESSGGKKKSGGRARKGSLIASADVVVIRNGSDYKAVGNDNLKINSGMTYANTDQSFSGGLLVNYTTGQNEIVGTGYGSWKVKEAMFVGSNSFLYNHKQETWFNTSNMMYAFKQSRYTTMLVGTNFSVGKLGQEGFSNWAAQAGVFTTFNGYRGVSINLMGVGMYSPYTFFYEGQWFEGGFILVPLTSFDFSVTNTFKLNISTSTVLLQGEGILNFQLMSGAKMLL